MNSESVSLGKAGPVLKGKVCSDLPLPSSLTRYKDHEMLEFLHWRQGVPLFSLSLSAADFHPVLFCCADICSGDRWRFLLEMNLWHLDVFSPFSAVCFTPHFQQRNPLLYLSSGLLKKSCADSHSKLMLKVLREAKMASPCWCLSPVSRIKAENKCMFTLRLHVRARMSWRFYALLVVFLAGSDRKWSFCF